VTSNVDTSVAGTYYVHYNVSDAAGNTALQVTRTVTVASVPTSPAGIARYPPGPMTANVTTLAGFDYGNGEYIVSKSSEFRDDTVAWTAFNFDYSYAIIMRESMCHVCSCVCE